jgi:signal transduction histidine kinase
LTLTERIVHVWRRYRAEVIWCAFVTLNLAGMLIFRDWATVPFHFIWISLSLIYGWRVWPLRATSVSLALIAVITALTESVDIMSGNQALDELTEIPLMAAVFAAMVIFVRRSVAAREEISRVYEHNVGLLEYTRDLIRHASHIVRTPLTIALGYAEIIQRTTDDLTAGHDAEVVVDELMRLKQATDRLLELATSQQPDFVRPAAASIRELLTDICDRWSADGAQVCLAEVDDGVFPFDADRLKEALSELIDNAVAETTASPGAPIEISAREDGDCEVIAVADRGPGIREDDGKTIFERFTRADGNRKRGAHLGLPIVTAIAEAHGGSVGVRDRPGGGAIVELRLPLHHPAGTPERAAWHHWPQHLVPGRENSQSRGRSR